MPAIGEDACFTHTVIWVTISCMAVPTQPNLTQFVLSRLIVGIQSFRRGTTQRFSVRNIELWRLVLPYISLIGLRAQKSIRDPKFQVRIKFKQGAETENRVATVKKDLVRNEDRVVWNESFCFVGDITNSVITLKVHRTQFISTRLVGRFEEKASDLLRLQNDSEFCKFDIDNGEGREGQLLFKIERRPALLSDIVLDASKSSMHISTGHLVSSVHDSLVTQENIWSPFLSQFQNFMTAVDGVAGIHPYVQLAWSILSVLPRTVITHRHRNDNVKELCEKLEQVYKFITDAERFPLLDKTATNVLSLLVRQTVECAYLIRDYSKGHTAENIWKGSSIDDKIKGFIDKFDHLRKVMTEFVTLDTGIITLRVSKTVSEIRNLHLLDDMPYARDAGFISNKRCLAGTRQNLIREIIEWVNSDASSGRILVLSGQAGTGKSAVAHTIAEIFQKQNRLGSLFCFNRSYSDRNKYLFSTLTRDLADGDVLWRQGLAECVDITAIRRSTDMETQFNEFIVKPSQDISTIGPVVIVIDALDESGNSSERQALLDILFGRLSELPTNYRFILTTRPEQDIDSHCQGPTVLCKRMGDISEKDTLLDIQNYVSHRLKRSAKILDEIQRDWREILARRAEGLFQWAETACQTMDSVYHQPSLTKAWNVCTSGASTSLYQLYHNIISSQRDCEYAEFMKDFRLVVGAIITTREPLTTNSLQNIFEDIVQDVKSILRPFGSLLVGVHDEFTPIRALHTSLLDFFQARTLDATNENKYYVDTSDQSLFTSGCLRLMNRSLCFNICNLETSHVRNRDVPDFSRRVREAIPPHLSYASRFWGSHLQYAKDRKDDIILQLRILMREKLLYWFEALGLLGEVEKGPVAMRILRIWCQGTDNELAEQAADAEQFGFDYGDIIEESTPHLYLSALPFTPSHSFISKLFSPFYPRCFSIEGGQQLDYVPQTPFMKKRSSSAASSLAFSPEGKYIATGFENDEFWFWNRESGEILYQWKVPKKGSIDDIIFSPDGRSVYCCYKSGHIRIWNVNTKETMDDSHLDILEGKCRGCIVSSDSHYVIFYTDTGPLLLCDRMSRQRLIQFHGYYPVFTPNGGMLAFVDPYDDLCLWDIHQQTFVNYWKANRFHRFALSDRQIAFSLYNSIQVWDMHSLTMVCKFEATIIFGSILFTSNQRLLSRSYNTYTVWDISTGEVVIESSLGHSKMRALAVSSDSKYVALSTDDCTTHVGPLGIPIKAKTSDIVDRDDVERLWMRGRHLVQLYHLGLRGHRLLISDTVAIINVFAIECSSHVAVSPRNDHVYVAFVAARGLSVWNDTEGEFILDKSRNTTCLKYSPLGDRLISVNESGVINIWDVNARTLIGGPYRVPGNVLDLAFSATEDNYMVAYGTPIEAEVLFTEVRVCQSGHVLNGPFKSVYEYPLGAIHFSTNKTKIILMTRSGVKILDAVTGKNRQDYFGEMLMGRLVSPNSKYIGWCRRDQNMVELWDIDNQVILHQLLPNGDLRDVFFSDDSVYIIALYSLDHRYYIDIWDISTKKAVKHGIQIPPTECYDMSLNGTHLILSDWHIPKIVDLNIHQLVSSFYEYHGNHSRFGMLPIDNSEARQEIQTLSLPSRDEDILEYALMAWDKALFSMGAGMDEDGWLLGPHDELLVWIPKERRDSLWRPCMTYMGTKDFTKLKFDNFVHGTRWMECKGDL